MAVQFTEYSNHYEGCGKRNNESLCFISFQSMSGNHEAFQSNHSSHLSLIKFSAVSTDLRRKKDTACLVFQHFESFKQYCRWEYGHKCILFFIISLRILKRKCNADSDIWKYFGALENPKSETKQNIQKIFYFCRWDLCETQILFFINCLQVIASAVLECCDMLQYIEEQIQNIDNLSIKTKRELRQKGKTPTNLGKRQVRICICHLTYLSLSQRNS